MLLDNALDRDFQTMLLPLNLLEFLYFQPKYRISGALITPNGIRGKVHLILGVVLIICTNVGNIFVHDFVAGNSLSESAFALVLTDVVFYSVSSIFVCTAHLMKADQNVQLINKIQRAFRVLYDTNGLKRFQRGNWIWVVSLFLSYLMYNLSYTLFKIYRITHCIYNMIIFYFDVNVIVAVRIVKFLEYELVLWKKEVGRFFQTCSKTNHEQLVKYLIDAGDEQKRLFSAYTNIIDAFKLCPAVFGMSILVLVIEGFGHPLIYVQYILEMRKSSTEDPQVSSLSLLVSLLWIVKTFTILTCLCTSCQRFHLAVAEVEAACAAMLGEDGCLVYVHRLSKNVIRHSACVGARDEMRACYIVPIGASTPLQLLTLLGTYTVVLLQFAFL